MTHLAENAAVRAGNSFDRHAAAIGVEPHIHRRIAGEIHILRGNLPVLSEAADCFIIRQEAAFAVADRHRIYIAYPCFPQPGAPVAGHTGADDPALVAGNRVKGQRRTGRIGIDDLAKGHEAQLDQRLEAIADSAYEAIPLLQQLLDRLANCRIAEECRDKLCAAVRLVPAGETARNEDRLTPADFIRKPFHAACDALCGKIIDDHDPSLGTGIFHRPGAVVFTVCARESRNQDLRLRRLHRRHRPCLRFAGIFLRRIFRRRNVTWENAFQPILPNLLQLIQRDGLAAQREHPVRRYTSQCNADFIIRRFQNEIPVAVCRQFLHRPVLRKADAEAVSEGHLHHGFQNAAHTGRIACSHLSFPDQGRNDAVIFQKGLRIRQTVGVFHRAQERKPVPGLLQLRRNDIPGFRHRDRKGNQRRRHIQIFKGAAHGILSTDGTDSQRHLRLERAQERRKGLTPAGRFPAGLLKILLESQINIAELCAGSDQLADGFNHGEIGTVVRAPLHDKGIIAPGHQRTVIRMLFLHADLLNHGLDRGQLILSAEGHQDSARTNR